MARSTDRTPDRELLARTPTFGEYPSDEVISGRLLGRRKFLARGGLAFLGASALGSSLGFPLGPLAAIPEADPKDPYGKESLRERDENKVPDRRAWQQEKSPEQSMRLFTKTSGSLL